MALCALAGALACQESQQKPQPSSEPSPTPPAAQPEAGPWSEPEATLLRSLSLDALPPPPPDPSNRVADHPAAAELGHRFFFDAGFSKDGSISCATCHQPALLFTDGRSRSRGIGQTARNSPTLSGVAHSTWMFWDGRRDSLWAQALAPFETPAELGSTRTAVARRATTSPATAFLYARVFGPPPDLADRSRFPERASPFGSQEERAAWNRMKAVDRRTVDQVFANVGKAIAAYERLLEPGPARFDRYVSSLSSGNGGRVGSPSASELLSDEELQGLRLFIDSGRTLCLRCHNGPLLTNQSFHHVATATGTGGLPDFGRFLGVQALLMDPFNCRGEFSDAAPQACRELRFLDKSDILGEMGKFKTPTLRGLPRTGPYMHDGRFATLGEVMEHYRNPPPRESQPHELVPLEIDESESRALVAFLSTLDGDLRTDARWLEPPREPGDEP